MLDRKEYYRDFDKFLRVFFILWIAAYIYGLIHYINNPSYGGLFFVFVYSVGIPIIYFIKKECKELSK